MCVSQAFFWFLFCLFVLFILPESAKENKLIAMTHTQFVVLFSLYFQVRSNTYFPFFLCNVIESNIVSRSHALRHGKWHLTLRDTWGCWVGEGVGFIVPALRFSTRFFVCSEKYL